MFFNKDFANDSEILAAFLDFAIQLALRVFVFVFDVRFFGTAIIEEIMNKVKKNFSKTIYFFININYYYLYKGDIAKW